MDKQKILIAAGSGGTNIGDAFWTASKYLNLEPVFLNTHLAYEAPIWLRKINWTLRGKYPSQLKSFSQNLAQVCCSIQPTYLVTTGIAPVDQTALKQVGKMGVKRINFLTDDPWNAAHYAPWFFKALSEYDIIFSPRRANINDLIEAGCRKVVYLPFGYNPELFYCESCDSIESDHRIPDVVFAGTADRDRIPYMNALIQSGISVDLYGTYWERYSETRNYTHGQADIQTLRKAIQRAKLSICLVRRANRDGHCMRTFEVPALGGCMLTEDTQEHREIFGPDGEAVVYFSTISEMVEKARWLLDHEAERQRLASTAYQLITQGANTYRDRLKTMLLP
jgi:spore maturation protein CgeB